MLDFSNLLLPISEEFPGGKDVRESNDFNSLYFRIKEERFAARSLERDFNDDNASSHWLKVYELSYQVLEEQSKDTQILCWFIEAALRLYGFEGLAAAFQITSSLMNEYWDHLYPEINEEGYEARFSPFYGLNGDDSEGALIFPLLNIAISQPITVPAFTTWQYKEAQVIEKISDPQKKAERLASSSLSIESIDIAIKETKPEFFKNLSLDLNKCLKNLETLDNTLAEKGGEAAPSFRQIKETLHTCFNTLRSFAVDALEPNSSIPLTESEHEDSLLQESSSTSLDREKALKDLTRIANFFKHSEPQSPLPYLLEKAVRWGRISLQELLQEWVEDEATLKDIFRLMGIESVVKE